MALTSDQITAQNFADFYQKILPYLNGGGMGMKLLWENSDPSSAFAAQNITIDSDDYDLLLFIGRVYVTTQQSISTIAPKGTSTVFICNAGNDLHGCQRNFTRTNDTEYAVSDAMETSGSGTATANNRAIPYRIYGIKVYNRDVPGKTTLLWSNQNPSSAFAAQNIELANSDYDQLTIICDTYTNAKTFVSVITVKGNGAVISYTRYDSGSSPRTRTFTYTDATHLSVGDALVNGAANNSHLIPMYVYGTKL